MSQHRRRDPLHELLDLQERINHLFDASLSRGKPEGVPGGSTSWIPLADVFETPACFVIKVELPGVRLDEINLQVDPHEVVIRGERASRGASRPESFHRLERTVGPFQRSFRLTQAVEPEQVRAELRDGVLRVELPKCAENGSARIRIARER
jgi:HSP20 family protein